MIPQQFHWVWLGPNHISEKDQKWMRSWQEKHPAWSCTIWAEHPENINLEDFEVRPLPPLINQKFYNGIEQWVTGRAATASRSDIVRYEIMLQGGIYLDTDVECFGNIEHLLQGVTLFVADEWGPCNGNYMFGALPNHPAIYTVVRELGSHLNSLKSAVNAVQATGPAYLNKQLQKYQDLVVYPHMLFNPLCAFDSPEQVTKWPEVSLANHHFDGKWYDRTKNEPPLEFRS
jgi:mannosyltransferase OCH1-like enzyme